MARNVTIKTNDRHGETTSTTHGVIVGATNPQIQAIADAWDAVLRGTAVGATVSEQTVVDAGVTGKAGNVEASRGDKWAYVLQDTVKPEATYQHELGCADLQLLAAPDSDDLDLGAGVGLALKQAIDAVAESPDGNPAVVTRIYAVDRAA